MGKCRHCGKEQEEPRIRIGVKTGRNTKYFYFPENSCNNDIDGMNQLVDYVDELRKKEREYSMFLQEEKDDRFANCVEDVA